MENFTYKNSEFYLNGKEFKVYSGAIHYFRMPREYWCDRLLKLKECGFNTVETYIAWNVHEPKEGEFDFSGDNDVAAFLRMAQELGLYAIVRPGPFICAEWEAGGFPPWLFKDRNVRVRCNDVRYMEKVENYLTRLFDELRPNLLINGGNVFMMQVENEYGSYGNDKSYLRRLVEIYRKCKMDCLLFTADGAWINMLVKGSLTDECLPFVTFGSRTEVSMRSVDPISPNTPKMCAEFWCGWFDHWGEEHHTRTSEDILKDFVPFLENGWNFNFYMFFGGTNFGFMNGANFAGGKLQPTVTSYDCCAPLNEAGDRTENYYKIRDEFIKHDVPVPPLTAKDSEKAAYGRIDLSRRAFLFDNLGEKHIKSPYPLTMEEVGQNYGYILYSTVMPRGMESDRLYIDGLADRAIVFVDGEKLCVFDRNELAPEIWIDTLGKEKKLDILVENRGRINYGKEIYDRKGVTAVRHGDATLFGFEIRSFEMKSVSSLSFTEAGCEKTDMPVFCSGCFDTEKPCDTFVKIDGATRGFIEINGRNIGRFNNAEGPQKTLYVPAPFLKKGINVVTVFSSDGAESTVAAVFTDTPEL